MFFEIECIDWYTSEPFALHIDDISVRAWPQARGEPVASLIETFDGDGVDPALQLNADAGLAAVLDGKLLLEKLANRVGGVEILLAPSRALLTGDPSVSFDLELSRFDVPEGQEAKLEFDLVDTGTGGGFGHLELVGGEPMLLRASTHAEEAAIEWSDTIEKLRIRREGSSLLHEYWDGTWHTLLARPNVHAKQFFFTIRLGSQARDAALLVAIDDLEARSLEKR